MRILFCFFVFYLVLFGTACRNIDQVLVTELQERGTELDSLQANYRSFYTDLNKYLEQRGTLADSLLRDSVIVAYQPLFDTMLLKQTEPSAQIKEARQQLASLHTDYTSGVKQTDDVRPEFQRIAKMYRDYQIHLDTMQQRYYEVQYRITKYATQDK